MNLFSVLVLVVVGLSSLMKPVYATTVPMGAEPSPYQAEALPGWWGSTLSHTAVEPREYGALPGWWSPAQPVAALHRRPLQQDVAYIRIVDAPGGTGVNVTTHTMPAGDTLEVWAAGYTAADVYVDDVEATWTGTDVVAGRLEPTVGISTTFTAVEAGTGTVQAVDGLGHTAETGTITVEPGVLDHIVIRDAPGGSGSELIAQSITIYETLDVWAAGYDAHGNYLDDLSVDWSLTGNLGQGEIEPPSGTSATFTPPVASVTGRIVAVDSDSGKTATSGLITVQAPELIVSKRGLADPIHPGEVLRYTIVYTNAGDGEAQGVRITEAYASNVSYFYAIPEPINPPPDAANVWAPGTLEPGVGTIDVWVQVDDPLAPGTVLTNVVTVGGSRLAQDTFFETTVVTSTPDLTLTFTALADSVNAGAGLWYQVHYENHGDAPVSGAHVTLTLDAHVTLADSTPWPDGEAEDVKVWNVGSVDTGPGGDIWVRVVVDDFMVDQDILSSEAAIKSSETPEYITIEDTLVNAPELALVKSAARDPALAGDELIYTLVYSNVGHAAASALVITDAVPKGSDYVGCLPAPCSESSGVVTWWKVSGLAQGSSHDGRMTVAVDQDVDSDALLTNKARVWVVATELYSATAHITTAVINSPLWLSIDNGRTSVEAGDRLTYTVRYTNSGEAIAEDVEIAVTPPASDVAWDPYCDPSSGCRLSNGKLIYDRVGALEGGESGTVTMLCTMRDPLPAGTRSIRASAVISTTSPGDPPEGNTAEDVDEIATRPDLVVVDVSYENTMLWPGKRVTYTLLYNNRGHIATTGVAITATKSLNSLFSQNGSDECWKAQGAGRYRCVLGSLDYYQFGLLTFVVTLPDTLFSGMTDFDATFEINDDGCSGEDAKPNNNVFEAPLGVPNLVIEDVEVQSSVWISEPGWVTVTVKNTGTGRACGVLEPGNCHEFALDLYLDPETPPLSYPSGENGDCYTTVDAVFGGQTATAVIAFTIDPLLQDKDLAFCKAKALNEIWFKVDNWGPMGKSPPADFGLVAEYDEYDNVYSKMRPPCVSPWCVYLPLFSRNFQAGWNEKPSTPCFAVTCAEGQDGKMSLDNRFSSVYNR